jgi:hypothetical protein
MPHDLMADLIRVLGGRVHRVAITGQSEIALHATISVAVNGRTEDVDARPSDALLLAVRTGVPVVVSQQILDREGVSADKLSAKLPPREVETEVMAAGDWRSLSVDLLRSLHRPPKES